MQHRWLLASSHLRPQGNMKRTIAQRKMLTIILITLRKYSALPKATNLSKNSSKNHRLSLVHPIRGNLEPWRTLIVQYKWQSSNIKDNKIAVVILKWMINHWCNPHRIHYTIKKIHPFKEEIDQFKKHISKLLHPTNYLSNQARMLTEQLRLSQRNAVKAEIVACRKENLIEHFHFLAMLRVIAISLLWVTIKTQSICTISAITATCSKGNSMTHSSTKWARNEQ